MKIAYIYCMEINQQYFLLSYPECLYATQSKSEWLFNTQSRVLQADWLILENNEKAALSINMPYRAIALKFKKLVTFGNSEIAYRSC